MIEGERERDVLYMRTIAEFVCIVEPILDRYANTVNEANKLMQNDIETNLEDMTEEESKLLLTLLENKMQPLQE